jgi:hypothetical protein
MRILAGIFASDVPVAGRRGELRPEPAAYRHCGGLSVQYRRGPNQPPPGTGDQYVWYWLGKAHLDSDAGLLQLFIGTEFMRLTPLFAAIRRGAVLLLRAESV